jgi:hypothetical protein
MAVTLCSFERFAEGGVPGLSIAVNYIQMSVLFSLSYALGLVLKRRTGNLSMDKRRSLPLRFDEMADVRLDRGDRRRLWVLCAQAEILEGDLERVRDQIRKKTNEVRKAYETLSRRPSTYQGLSSKVSPTMRPSAAVYSRLACKSEKVRTFPLLITGMLR